MGNNHLGMIFPGYADYQPLGIVGGDDLPPDYTTTADIILSDGFESGNTGRWTSTVG
jgi:hypothetical protein